MTDTNPLVIQDGKINYSRTYLYLAAWFSDDVDMNTIMSLHEKSNETHMNKFGIFCSANTDMPYVYKKMVFDAAITSSLLYSSETWFNEG